MKNLLKSLLSLVLGMISFTAYSQNSKKPVCNNHGNLVSVNYVDFNGNEHTVYDFNFDKRYASPLTQGDTVLVVKDDPKVYDEPVILVMKASDEFKDVTTVNLTKTFPSATSSIGIVTSVTKLRSCNFNEVENLFYVQK